MLDIYVVSLSSAWISDSVLMGLMGRVPKVRFWLRLRGTTGRGLEDGRTRAPESMSRGKRRALVVLRSLRLAEVLCDRALRAGMRSQWASSDAAVATSWTRLHLLLVSSQLNEKPELTPSPRKGRDPPPRGPRRGLHALRFALRRGQWTRRRGAGAGAEEKVEGEGMWFSFRFGEGSGD